MKFSVTNRTIRTLLVTVGLLVIAFIGIRERLELVCRDLKRPLSSKELEDIAISRIINHQPRYIDVSIREQKLLRYGHLPYKNISEFRKNNPDCCNISDEGSDGEVTLSGLLFGRTAHWVNLDYRVIYKTPGDRVGSSRMRESYPIDRCGAISIE